MSFSFWGYGSLLNIALGSRDSDDELSTAPVFGLGIFCQLAVMIGTGGHYNLVGMGGLVFVGIALAFLQWKRQTRVVKISDFPKKWLSAGLLFLVFPALFFLCRFVNTSVPQQHSDPLYYHVLAPWHWAEMGRITLESIHPSYAQATLWEVVYGIPAIVFQAAPISDLTRRLMTQVSSQWLHFFGGQIASFAIAAQILFDAIQKSGLCNRDKKHQKLKCIFWGWLAISFAAMEWTGTLAKNDYILLVFLLAALHEVLKGSLRSLVLAGFYVGCAYSSKVFAIWSALAFLVFIPVRRWPLIILPALIAILPVAIRNGLSSGNPFFPVLDVQLGPGWTSQSWRIASETFAGPPQASWAMLQWFWARPLAGGVARFSIVAMVVVSAILLRRRQFQTAFKILAFFLIQATLALLILKPDADGRYAVPFLIMTFLLVLREILPDLPRWGIVFILLGFTVRIPVESLVKVPRDYWFSSSSKYLQQFHPLQPMIEWLHANTNPKDKIYFHYDKALFYFSRDFECISEMASWEREMNASTNLSAYLSVLEERGFRYLVLPMNPDGVPAMGHYSKELFAKIGEASFKNNQSVVFDLKRIYK